MAASQDDIRGWLMRGKRDGATHVIIVCDTFDFTDFPVYVTPHQDIVTQVTEEQGKSMQKVMEVYNLSLPFGPQLNEDKAWHLDLTTEEGAQ